MTLVSSLRESLRPRRLFFFRRPGRRSWSHLKIIESPAFHGRLSLATSPLHILSPLSLGLSFWLSSFNMNEHRLFFFFQAAQLSSRTFPELFQEEPPPLLFILFRGVARLCGRVSPLSAARVTLLTEGFFRVFSAWPPPYEIADAFLSRDSPLSLLIPSGIPPRLALMYALAARSCRVGRYYYSACRSPSCQFFSEKLLNLISHELFFGH